MYVLRCNITERRLKLSQTLLLRTAAFSADEGVYCSYDGFLETDDSIFCTEVVHSTVQKYSAQC